MRLPLVNLTKFLQTSRLIQAGHDQVQIPIATGDRRHPVNSLIDMVLDRQNLLGRNF